MKTDSKIAMRLQFLVRVARKERPGLTESAGKWMATRNLGNQMVHDYAEDAAVLTRALQTGHAFVPALTAEIERRGRA